ncbi:MAG: hypothetical protein N0E54_10310 [Candidatus Thiodiazotropha taylori]|nr:hypothetical protein [Candidatus Thiodiazotropha endolucinida]MCW4229119.1 hypothetical protein [Candidatus Thiodiazotropha taylori]
MAFSSFFMMEGFTDGRGILLQVADKYLHIIQIPNFQVHTSSQVGRLAGRVNYYDTFQVRLTGRQIRLE